MRKRHHIVSRGYQRFFADGDRIRVTDKAVLAGRTRRLPEPIGTRDAFVRKHFCGHLDATGQHVDVLEDEWTRLESMALPHVRRFIDGDPDPACRTPPRSSPLCTSLGATGSTRPFSGSSRTHVRRVPNGSPSRPTSSKHGSDNSAVHLSRARFKSTSQNDSQSCSTTADTNRVGWRTPRYHDSRHASVLLSGGVSVAAVADYMGHSPAVLLKTYAHLIPADNDRAQSVCRNLLRPPDSIW